MLKCLTVRETVSKHATVLGETRFPPKERKVCYSDVSRAVNTNQTFNNVEMAITHTEATAGREIKCVK